MSTDIYRLKQDIHTMEQALGCKPEFGRGTVWASVGWGIFGVVLTVLGTLHYTFSNRWVGAAVMVTLWLGLPYLLSRLARRFASPTTYGATQMLGSAKDLGSLPLTGIILAALLGLGLWMTKLELSSGLFLAAICFVGSLWCLVAAWGKPWRGGLFVWALAFAALGFALPFLPKGTGGLAMGAAVAFAGFVGAAILNWQLNHYYAHGQAAH